MAFFGDETYCQASWEGSWILRNWQGLSASAFTPTPLLYIHSCAKYWFQNFVMLFMLGKAIFLSNISVFVYFSVLLLLLLLVYFFFWDRFHLRLPTSNLQSSCFNRVGCHSAYHGAWQWLFQTLVKLLWVLSLIAELSFCWNTAEQSI